MKLLNENEYKIVENLLKEHKEENKEAINEIIIFFDVPVYRDFLQLFYFDRHKYKNRYPDNRSMLQYLCKILFVQESTLYMIRKEIMYKSTMIFYKYKLI